VVEKSPTFRSAVNPSGERRSVGCLMAVDEPSIPETVKPLLAINRNVSTRPATNLPQGPSAGWEPRKNYGQNRITHYRGYLPHSLP
jgi:hypothetical protein